MMMHQRHNRSLGKIRPAWGRSLHRAIAVVLEQEMAKLMGEDLDDVDLRVTTKNQMRQMIGLSMHVATAGFALTGLMAAFGAGGMVGDVE